MLKRNLPQNLSDLKSGCISPKKFIKNQHVNNDLIKRLCLETELIGHKGCVNCLEWNETGELLASGSDDTHIMMWDTFNHKRVADIETFHKGNIFSVKFMPKSNNSILASGAADSCVKVINLAAKETVIENYYCHQNRVKRLAVNYNEPYLLWSCSEDGTIRQYDIRENANSQNSVQSSNVLINLNCHSNGSAAGCEVKCLAINPVRSDQLAVGSNDYYVRLYDRRKLSLKSFQNFSEKKNKEPLRKFSNGTTVHSPSDDQKYLPDDAVQYYVPSHIPWNNQTDKFLQYTCTYLTFSPDGNNLLVNMGSEQVYLYDVNKTRPLFSFNSTLAKHVATCDCELLCDYSSIADSSNYSHSSATNCVPNLSESEKESNMEMLPHLNIFKDKGNKMYKNSDYHSAIMYYNTALQQGGDVYARFYANRAAAYISRNWAGDIYAALLDSIKALEIDYYHIKSHFRIAQCLFQLNMVAESNDYIKYFKFLFPEDSKKIKQVEELEKKIVDKISDIINKEVKEKTKDNSSNGSNRSSSNVIPSPTNIVDTIAKHMKTQRYIDQKSLCEQELLWRSRSNDYVNRFCGHCNTTTDIKEANFFGINGQYIMAGSDEGNIFFWDRFNENIIRVVCGDTNIVNCLQPHPTVCFLASSGIDSVIRLWSPSLFCNNEKFDDEKNKIGSEQNEIKAAQSNQNRINSDPLELMLMNLGYPHRIFSQQSDENEDGDELDGGEDDDDDNDNSRDSSSNTPRRNTHRRRIHLDNTEYCRTS